MKNLIKILFITTLCLPLTLSAQQWSGGTNTTSTISRSGEVDIDNTTTVRRLHIKTNTVTTRPDISLSAQAMIETESNMFLNIDSDNNTNNAALTIGKNSPTTTGYTALFKVHEAGNAYLYSGHYRTYGDGGLYNQTDKTYFYSDNDKYFRLRSDRGLSIANRNNDRMGTLYHNNNNAFGLLDGDGNWVFRSQIDDNIGFYVDNDLKMSIMNSGEIISTPNPGQNNMRYVQGNYGIIHRNDGQNYYILLTNSGDAQGNWNDLRPFQLNNTNGNIHMGNLTLNVLHGQGVGIGTTNLSGYKLAVNGSIRSKEVVVESNWSDYVFYDDYDLPTLEEEEKHIEANGHLLGFESEKAMSGEIQLGDVSKRQQAKIEEIILHLIEIKKEVTELKEENKQLKKQLGTRK